MTNNAEATNSKIQMEIDDCRAGLCMAEGYAECLREGPNTCDYALPFGYCFLCHHPRLEEILEHTNELEKAETV